MNLYVTNYQRVSFGCCFFTRQPFPGRVQRYWWTQTLLWRCLDSAENSGEEGVVRGEFSAWSIPPSPMSVVKCSCLDGVFEFATLSFLDRCWQFWNHKIILNHIKTPLYLVKSPFPIHVKPIMTSLSMWNLHAFPLGSWYDRVLNNFWLWLEKHMLVWSNKFMIANNKTLHLIHGWWCEWKYVYIYFYDWLSTFPGFCQSLNGFQSCYARSHHCLFPIASLFFGLKFCTQANEQNVHS